MNFLGLPQPSNRIPGQSNRKNQIPKANIDAMKTTRHDVKTHILILFCSRFRRRSSRSRLFFCDRPHHIRYSKRAKPHPNLSHRSDMNTHEAHSWLSPQSHLQDTRAIPASRLMISMFSGRSVGLILQTTHLAAVLACSTEGTTIGLQMTGRFN